MATPITPDEIRAIMALKRTQDRTNEFIEKINDLLRGYQNHIDKTHLGEYDIFFEIPDKVINKFIKAGWNIKTEVVYKEDYGNVRRYIFSF